MANLLQRIEANLATHSLLIPNERVVVAVSGGVDSMLLLHVLHSLAKANGWALAVAHFNHRLRGPESDGDEKLVRETAAQLDLPVYCESAHVKKVARQRSMSVEMAARELRHLFLARAAKQFGANKIALAHHADDQMELFFLRLFRGTSGEGIAGMKWSNPSPVDSHLLLFRPLLDISKQEIVTYAKQQQIPFREDSSNQSLHFERNWIRLELLPQLLKHYPGLPQALLRFSELASAEAQFAGLSAHAWQCNPNRPSFADLHPAAQRRCLHSQLLDRGINPEFELIEQLRTNPGTPVTVGSGVIIKLNPSGALENAPEKPVGFSLAKKTVSLRGKEGSVSFAEKQFHWQVRQRKAGEKAIAWLKAVRSQSPYPSGTEYFDLKKVGSTITLRHWQPGDRFQPIGLKEPVKLQDLFVNAKIPVAKRRQLIVAEATDGRLMWVEGLRISEPFKVVETSKKILAWSLTVRADKA
jgi:tRNA(Ile)-lysidine synthase